MSDLLYRLSVYAVSVILLLFVVLFCIFEGLLILGFGVAWVLTYPLRKIFCKG